MIIFNIAKLNTKITITILDVQVSNLNHYSCMSAERQILVRPTKVLDWLNLRAARRRANELFIILYEKKNPLSSYGRN